jgi:hypothetical protein
MSYYANLDLSARIGLIAIAFLLVSISTVVYPNQELYSEIFMLPIGALFACTAIRANLPGAPSDFGTSELLSTIYILSLKQL